MDIDEKELLGEMNTNIRVDKKRYINAYHNQKMHSRILIDRLKVSKNNNFKFLGDSELGDFDFNVWTGDVNIKHNNHMYVLGRWTK